MKLLKPDEQHTLHHRYKQSDLYRQWSPILAMLQRQYNEADAQTLWHVAEQQIVRLRSEQAFIEQEIVIGMVKTEERLNLDAVAYNIKRLYNLIQEKENSKEDIVDFCESIASTHQLKLDVTIS